MADEFDPCECVYSQDSAMQRLLTMLRDGQSYCTDSECMEPPMSGNANPGDSTMLLMALWMIVAVALFFMRPDSARRSQDPTDATQEKAAAAIGTNNNNNNPPPPPAL